MIGYIIRKVGYALAVLFGVVTTAFLINFVLPGDPARLMLGQRADEQSIKALRVQLGLDKPMYEQYTKYVFRLVQGDLGVSYSTNREVLDTIVDKFPATALLAITAMFFSTLIGIGLGIIAAIRANTWVDASTMGFALLGISLPSFVFGLLLLLLFAEIWKIFPSSGYIDKGISHLFLPMLTLAFRPLSIIARVTRSSMLDVLNQDYVRTARAKGLTEKAVILKHALRNALNPVVTTVSAWFSGMVFRTSRRNIFRGIYFQLAGDWNTCNQRH